MSLNVKRTLAYVLGLIIFSFGISLVVISNLGAGSWDALTVGLYTRFGLTVGTWLTIVGATLVLVNAVLEKRRPEFLPLVTQIILGYFIDIWLLLIFKNELIQGLSLQIPSLLIGVFCMGLGIATYLQAKFAIMPIDRFMLNIQKIMRVKVMYAKITAEIIALIAALIVGGPIGVGTLIATLFIGPIIQVFFPRLEKVFT